MVYEQPHDLLQAHSHKTPGIGQNGKECLSANIDELVSNSVVFYYRCACKFAAQIFDRPTTQWSSTHTHTLSQPSQGVWQKTSKGIMVAEIRPRWKSQPLKL